MFSEFRIVSSLVIEIDCVCWYQLLALSLIHRTRYFIPITPDKTAPTDIDTIVDVRMAIDSGTKLDFMHRSSLRTPYEAVRCKCRSQIFSQHKKKLRSTKERALENGVIEDEADVEDGTAAAREFGKANGSQDEAERPS